MWPTEKGKAVGDEGLVEERQQPGRTSSDSALILNTSGLQAERRHMTKQRKFFNSQQKELHNTDTYLFYLVQMLNKFIWISLRAKVSGRVQRRAEVLGSGQRQIKFI